LKFLSVFTLDNRQNLEFSNVEILVLNQTPVKERYSDFMNNFPRLKKLFIFTRNRIPGRKCLAQDYTYSLLRNRFKYLFRKNSLGEEIQIYFQGFELNQNLRNIMMKKFLSKPFSFIKDMTFVEDIHILELVNNNYCDFDLSFIGDNFILFEWGLFDLIRRGNKILIKQISKNIDALYFYGYFKEEYGPRGAYLPKMRSILKHVQEINANSYSLNQSQMDLLPQIAPYLIHFNSNGKDRNYKFVSKFKCLRTFDISKLNCHLTLKEILINCKFIRCGSTEKFAFEVRNDSLFNCYFFKVSPFFYFPNEEKKRKKISKEEFLNYLETIFVSVD
jgi:hypothetical protein